MLIGVSFPPHEQNEVAVSASDVVVEGRKLSRGRVLASKDLQNERFELVPESDDHSE